MPVFPLPPPAHDGPMPAAHAASDGTRSLCGVPYAAIPGVRPLELDLFLPPALDAPAPVVVFLHGGGWRMGSRHAAGPAYRTAEVGPFVRIARAGIAVACVDYRLSGESLWPAQLHDAKAAVRWLRARAGELGIDPDRIAVWGESAGGHLAELVGLTAGDESLEGDVGVTGPSSRVSAVVAWYAPSDITAVADDLQTDPSDPTSREALLLGAPVASVPDRAVQASPITYVSPGAPPFLLLHGRADRLIPCVQSQRLAQALTAEGNDVELHLLDAADHMWLGSPDAATDALDRSIAFLVRCLGAGTSVLGNPGHRS